MWMVPEYLTVSGVVVGGGGGGGGLTVNKALTNQVCIMG